MKDQLKVTYISIYIRNNGEWTGKGEVYCELLVDDYAVFSIPLSKAQKKADGETIQIGNSHIVTKASNETLVVSGSVSEKDDWDKDDTRPFTATYTKAMNWGIGTTHKQRLQDNHLDVDVTYKIERL